MLLQELNRVGTKTFWKNNEWFDNDGKDTPDMVAFKNPDGSWMARRYVFESIMNSVKGLSPSTQDFSFPDLAKLLSEIDGMLKEKYRFDVFAPDSINYGLLLNYRQHWQPQSYQVGNLAATIPLAPQETRRYTTKNVVKRTRNVKEIDDSLRTGKDESSSTWRVDSEIVNRAQHIVCRMEGLTVLILVPRDLSGGMHSREIMSVSHHRPGNRRRMTMLKRLRVERRLNLV